MSAVSYADFLASKVAHAPRRGLSRTPALSGHLFPFQRHCVEFLLEAGSGGLFLDTGLGKTLVQLEYAEHARQATNGRALILTPLAVAKQIEREARKFGYDARVIRDQSEAREGINVCNYAVQFFALADAHAPQGCRGAFSSAPDESPPPDASADIGMSTAAQIDGWLRERRRTAAPKPRALTCDDVYARQAAREAEAKRKQKEREERLKEAREIAAVFATAQREQDEQRQYEEQRYLRGIDPGFVSYCRERGIRDPQEIAYRWQRERGPSAPMFDPNEPIMPMRNRTYGY